MRIGLVCWKIRIQVEATVLCCKVIGYETSRYKALLTQLALAFLNQIINQTKNETTGILIVFSVKDKFTTGFHSTYPTLGKKNTAKEEGKISLGISRDVIRFFGFVGNCMRLKIVFAPVHQIVEHREAFLFVVGEVLRDMQQSFSRIKELYKSTAVYVEGRYVSDEEISLFLSIGDLVIQRCNSAVRSGICHSAYESGRLSVDASFGYLTKIIIDRLKGQLVSPNDTRVLALTIADSRHGETLSKLTAHAIESKQHFYWQKLSALACSA